MNTKDNILNSNKTVNNKELFPVSNSHNSSLDDNNDQNITYNRPRLYAFCESDDLSDDNSNAQINGDFSKKDYIETINDTNMTGENIGNQDL